eukprot:917907-Alexandrium_andersonii.AAC.1
MLARKRPSLAGLNLAKSAGHQRRAQAQPPSHPCVLVSEHVAADSRSCTRGHLSLIHISEPTRLALI